MGSSVPQIVYGTVTQIDCLGAENKIPFPCLYLKDLLLKGS